MSSSRAMGGGGSAELPGAVSDGPDACEPSGGPGREVGLEGQHVDLLVPPGLGHCCPWCAAGASILLGAAACASKLSASQLVVSAVALDALAPPPPARVHLLRVPCGVWIVHKPRHVVASRSTALEREGVPSLQQRPVPMSCDCVVQELKT